MNKKFIVIICFAIILATCASMITIAVCYKEPVEERLYALVACAVSIEPDGTTICEDDSGNLWAFYGEGYKAGDKISLMMNNKGTDTIYDDEIVAIANGRWKERSE